MCYLVLYAYTLTHIHLNVSGRYIRNETKYYTSLNKIVFNIKIDNIFFLGI